MDFANWSTEALAAERHRLINRRSELRRQSDSVRQMAIAHFDERDRHFGDRRRRAEQDGKDCQRRAREYGDEAAACARSVTEIEAVLKARSAPESKGAGERPPPPASKGLSGLGPLQPSEAAQAAKRTNDLEMARSRRAREARVPQPAPTPLTPEEKRRRSVAAWKTFFAKRDDLVHVGKSVNQFQWLTGAGVALGLGIPLGFLNEFLGLVTFVGGIALCICAGERLSDEESALRKEFDEVCRQHGRPEQFPETASIMAMPKAVPGRLSMMGVFNRFVLKQ